jgi:hypothetical protein
MTATVTLRRHRQHRDLNPRPIYIVASILAVVFALYGWAIIAMGGQ